MKVKYFGKDLERLDVKKIEPRENIFFDIDDLPILFDSMYLLDNEDRDLMLLIFVSKKKQEEIGKLFDVTQEAISYQIKKLRSRIKFIKRLRLVQSDVDEFFEFVKTTSIPEHFVEAAVLMFYTTSQTASARILTVNQATVRYRFSSFIEMMKKNKIPRRFRGVIKYLRGLLRFHNRVKRIRRG